MDGKEWTGRGVDGERCVERGVCGDCRGRVFEEVHSEGGSCRGETAQGVEERLGVERTGREGDSSFGTSGRCAGESSGSVSVAGDEQQVVGGDGRDQVSGSRIDSSCDFGSQRGTSVGVSSGDTSVGGVAVAASVGESGTAACSGGESSVRGGNASVGKERLSDEEIIRLTVLRNVLHDAEEVKSASVLHDVSAGVTGDPEVEAVASGESVHVVVGKNTAKNFRKRRNARQKKLLLEPTEEEKEASRTWAVRRVAENRRAEVEAKVAEAVAEHRLRGLKDKDKTVVIDRLAVARLEEKINSSKARSQKSFKDCGSPVESVGSAMSASEFALKQQARRIDALQRKIDYASVQLEEYYKIGTADMRRRVAEIPEPYIPSDSELDAQDAEDSSEPTYEEMEEAAREYFQGAPVHEYRSW